jgi:hypothetical protein
LLEFLYSIEGIVVDPDPGSGALLTLGFGIRDEKNPDLGSGGINIPDQISKS